MHNPSRIREGRRGFSLARYTRKSSLPQDVRVFLGAFILRAEVYNPGMRVAVFSDIHGNLEALEAVLADIAGRKCDRRYCLGDVVGYGADPLGCIQVLQREAIPTVKGNHDDAVADPRRLDWFNGDAKRAILWTRKTLQLAERCWLGSNPLVLKVDDMLFAHASAVNPGDFEYIFGPDGASQSLQCQKEAICFIGHTHLPAVYSLCGGEIEPHPAQSFFLQPGHRYLVNVGSVGQPRNNTPASSYVIYDTERGQIEFVQVFYPVERAQAKIRKAGLPGRLSSRLALGE